VEDGSGVGDDFEGPDVVNPGVVSWDTVSGGFDVLGFGDDIEIGFSVLGVDIGTGRSELGSIVVVGLLVQFSDGLVLGLDLGKSSEVVMGTGAGLIVLELGVGLTGTGACVSGLRVVSGLIEVIGLVFGDGLGTGLSVLFSGLDFGTFSEVVIGTGTGLLVLGLTGIGLGASVAGGFGL